MKVVYCAECGHKLSEGAKFCPFCGAQIDRSVEQGSIDVTTEESKTKKSRLVAVFDSIFQSKEKKASDKDDNQNAINISDTSSKSYEPIPDAAQPVAEESSNTEAVDVSDASSIDSAASDDNKQEEEPSIGMSIISFFFPGIGFISALVNLGTSKKKAGRYGLCALAGFVIGFITRMAALV